MCNNCGIPNCNCNCDSTLSGSIYYDGLGYVCKNNLDEILFQIDTGDNVNDTLNTIFENLCFILKGNGITGAAGATGATGATGPAGPVGPAGADSTVPGPAGSNGANGTDGADGLSFRFGTGVPSSGLGIDGDSYVDLASPDLDYYTKTGGTWSDTTLNIKGTQGQNFFQGVGVPNPSLGVDGDSYLNSTNGDLYLKTSSAWGVTGNIYTAPVGLLHLFNAGKLSEQSLGPSTIGQSIQLSFSDDVSSGRFDYGATWTTNTWIAPSNLTNVSFGSVVNIEVSGVNAVFDNDVTLTIYKNGISFASISINIPAGTIDGTILSGTINSVATAFSTGDNVTINASIPASANYSTFIGKVKIGSIFYDVQL